MKKVDEKIAIAHTLGQDFFKMVRQRKPKELDEWIDHAAKSGISAMKGFANGITKDVDAVRAALNSEWSNGQVEVQVNRLKLIKRKMYGRANFDLLRKRVLGWPATPNEP
jgi:transposase